MSKIPILNDDDGEMEDRIIIPSEIASEAITSFFNYRMSLVETISKVALQTLKVIDNDNQRNHERRMRDSSECEPAKDVPKVSKAPLAPKSSPSASNRRKKGSGAG